MTQDTQGVIKERLITAAREGDVEIILGVLEEVHSDHHDDPSLQGAVDQLLSIRDSDDNTLLHIAARRGHPSIIDALLRHGFPIDALSSGSTALHSAVEGEQFACVKCLVRYGALIQKDNDGYTPIDIARQRGLKDACTFFDTYPSTKRFSGINTEPALMEMIVTPSSKRRMVVGISGATCSGKSTLTRSLVKYFDCKEPFHHMDTYWKEFNQFPREKGFVIGERPECLHMDLFTEELRRRRKQLGEDDILFVDGFLLLHSLEVRDLLDVKIFLQISEAECRRRRKARNPGTSTAYYEKVIWPSYQQYNGEYATHPPGLMNPSTLILNGELPMHEVQQEAVKFIVAKLKERE